jgi:hypothetical protein
MSNHEAQKHVTVPCPELIVDSAARRNLKLNVRQELGSISGLLLEPILRSLFLANLSTMSTTY